MLNFNWDILSSQHLITLMVVVVLIFIRPLLGHFLKKQSGSTQLGNWIIVYIFIFFIITYYRGAEVLTAPLLAFATVDITLNLIIVGFLILTLAFHLSRLFTGQFLPTVYERYQLDIGIRYTLNRMFHYVIMVIALLVTISAVGLDLGAFTVFAGVLGVGIGFGLQNLTSNFISGIVLLFERPIKIGDRVIVEDIIGDVERINMRATIIRSVNNERIIVPNSYFLEEHVINRSYETEEMRLVVPIGVSYQADPEQVRTILLEIAREEACDNDMILLDPEPQVFFNGFGSSSLDFQLTIWISDPHFLIRTQSNLNFRIFKRLKEEDIEIPFPQRDLHLKSIDPTVYNHLNK